MWYMIQALILTMGVVVVDIFAKDLKRIYVYGLIFTIMLFSVWFFSGKAHADMTSSMGEIVFQAKCLRYSD